MIPGLRFAEPSRESASGDSRTIAPASTDECSRALKASADRGWRVHPSGNGSWRHGILGADLVISTSQLDAITDIRPADLVVTVGAGVTSRQLADTLAGHGVWFPVDPPGTNRTVGSVLATGTSGPLRGGFGPVRDHVLAFREDW